MAQNPKSLAPFGDTLPQKRVRLDSAPDKADPEVVMMKLWEKENIPSTSRNCGWTSIEAILEGIPSGVSIASVSFLPNESRRVIEERDRQVVAATVQWMATNVGRCFYEQFQKEWVKAKSKKRKSSQ